MLDRPIELTAGATYSVKAFFTNPLSKSLTNVMFHVEGAKLTKSQKIPGRYVMSLRAPHYSKLLGASLNKQDTCCSSAIIWTLFSICPLSVYI